MAKSIDKIKSGLKLRTQPREGALTLRLGTRKYTLPFEPRLITSDEFVFIHIPPTAEILKLVGTEVEVVTSDAEAEKAVASFKKKRIRTRTTKPAPELPSDLKEILGKIPAGYKLVYSAAGEARLVKTRKRRK